MWRKLCHRNCLLIYKKINKACLYVIEICVSHCATELKCIWLLWIGINLYYVNKRDSGVFLQVCEFLHNDDFWDFLWIILQIFGWLLLDFLLLNWLFVNVIKIINLTNLKVYPAKPTRISFLIKSRFILSDYRTA